MTSRFEDLDRLLKQGVEAETGVLNQAMAESTASRAKHWPMIERALDVFADFNATVLQPRVPFQIVTRIKDGPTLEELQKPLESNPHFAYVLNLVPPPGRRPYGFITDDRFSSDWIKPEIDESATWGSWYPMSAMQFAVLLSPEYLMGQGKYADELALVTYMKAWGYVDPGDKTLLPQGVSVYSGDGGWDKTATTVTVKYTTPEVFETGIQQGLTLLAPHVIYHKEVLEGTFKK